MSKVRKLPLDPVTLRRELTEARLQQAATAEVLKTISRSAFDLQSLLDSLVGTAVRLCRADRGGIVRAFDGVLRYVATSGFSPAFREYVDANPLDVSRGSAVGRAVVQRRIVHIEDVRADPEFGRLDIARAGAIRTVLAVPLQRDDELIGVFVMTRDEPRPFDEREIGLLDTFADQAVIAIDNVRLFEQVEARTAELTEALEQQTATNAVLRVIAASPTDLKRVLGAVAESAARLCDAYDAAIFLVERGFLVFGAHHGPIPIDFVNWPLVRDWVAGRSVLDRQTIQVADLAAAGDEFPDGQAMAVRMGHRTIVATPLVTRDEVLGTIVLRRREVRSFSDKQLDLLKSFADQAVIAIGNARLFAEVQARNRDVTEALEQQTATSEILRVIPTSPSDVKPVFDVIAQNAVRLCGGEFCFAFRFDGSLMHFVAQHGAPEAAIKNLRGDFPARPHRGNTAARSILSGAVEQVADIRQDAEYTQTALADMIAYRSVIAVPMLKDGTTIGAIAVARSRPGLFPKRQVELLTTFADQAVIAIENVRLFTELETRNAELRELLQQQTVTANVLKVISRTAFDLGAVLRTLVDSAVRLCDARDATILLRSDIDLRVEAHSGSIPIDFESKPIARDWTAGRAVADRATVHVPDMWAAADEFPEGSVMARRLGVRTILSIPILRGQDEAIGALMIRHNEVRPFTDKQVELLKTFADQAVIAIENVRLLGELREALQQQTATADVLKAISRSTFDLDAILRTLVDWAADLCETGPAEIWRREGEVYRYAQGRVLDPRYEEIERAMEIRPGRGTLVGRVALAKETVLIRDVTEDPEYARKNDAALGGLRAMLGVPLMREGEIVGAFAMARTNSIPFSHRQIELVETFADQAVIAIENARLFEEVRARTAELAEALRQQTATAEVLKVISRSAFDLQSVLDTLVESAVQLCEADKGVILKREGDHFEWSAHFGHTSELVEYVKAHPFVAGRGTVTARVAMDGRTIHVEDVLRDPEFTGTEYQRRGGERTILGVPLMRDGSPMGAFTLARLSVRPFSDKQIELIETFADQAVIAIENARLFEEVRARTTDLEEALTFQKSMGQVQEVISRSASHVEPVLEAIVETAAERCDADMSVIRILKNGRLHHAASSRRNDPALSIFSQSHPIDPRDGSSIAGRVALERCTIHVHDTESDPGYRFLKNIGGVTIRTALGVPMLHDGVVVGVIVLLRRTVAPFSDRQISMVQTFADQAVIALANVQLFEKLESRTEELARSLEELRAAQDRLVQTEKLASLGQLTAGIAHEIKNPLNFINNFSAVSTELIDELQAALEGAAMDADQRSEIDELSEMIKGNLTKVVQHGRRADSIVKNMLLHSRKGAGEHRSVEINAVVEESLNLAYHGARAEMKGFNITLERSFDPQAGEVDLYPQEITRVLLNLISNGFYATQKRAADANGAAYEPTLSATTKSLGDRVEIRIRDNGIGIPPAVRERMFEPFFTTKPAGEGTGLGLSLSHDIVVKQHNGSISVDTEPGAFTEFRIVLPRAGTAPVTSGGDT